ncbi:MAG: hypothetical protein AB1730_00320 [Myxococcota bacterium]|jgi:hypothetical protein
MERIDSLAPVAETEALPATRSLASLLAELSSLGPLSAREQVPQVVAWLDSAPATEANAQELLKLLDADAFGAWTDDEGRPLKLRALLALLRMGYPWALHIKPEDLAWLRAAQRPFWRRNFKEIMAIGLWGGLLAWVGWLAWPYLSAWVSAGF